MNEPNLNLLVKNCSACGSDHEFEFQQMLLPDEEGYDYTGLCKNTGITVCYKHDD